MRADDAKLLKELLEENQRLNGTVEEEELSLIALEEFAKKASQPARKREP